MATLELRLPITRQDVEDHADTLLDSGLEGDQREAAIDGIMESVARYESWVQTRDPVEQLALRSAPVITGPTPDEDATDDGGGAKPSPAAARRRRGK